MEIRELRAFAAVIEAGSLSAAARRLHISQSALSQTIQSLERQLRIQLLTCDHAGVRPTAAGQVLAREALSLIEHHDRALAAVTSAAGDGTGVTGGPLRIGVPIEFPPAILPAALAQLAVSYPDTRADVRHSASSTQLAALRSGDLDVALVRDRSPDPAVDAVLAVRETLGVILSAERSSELADQAGVPLHRLAGLNWQGFARSDCPAWHDQITAILRGHGITVTAPRPENDRPVTAEVKLAAVNTGRFFALAPPAWNHSLPSGIAWHPLSGNPIVRRTWGAWRADNQRRDLAVLIASLDTTGPSGQSRISQSGR